MESVIVDAHDSLPGIYWACPLCIITLMTAHGEGRIHHGAAYKALEKSGLVQPWPDKDGYVQTTDKGRVFIEMILAVPLPVQKWVDPRDL